MSYSIRPFGNGRAHVARNLQAAGHHESPRLQKSPRRNDPGSLSSINQKDWFATSTRRILLLPFNQFKIRLYAILHVHRRTRNPPHQILRLVLIVSRHYTCHLCIRDCHMKPPSSDLRARNPYFQQLIWRPTLAQTPLVRGAVPITISNTSTRFWICLKTPNIPKNYRI